MFKNRTLQVSLAPKAKGEPATTKQIDMDQVDELVQIAMYHAEHVSHILVGVYLAKKVIDTTCTIAIIRASK